VVTPVRSSRRLFVERPLVLLTLSYHAAPIYDLMDQLQPLGVQFIERGINAYACRYLNTCRQDGLLEARSHSSYTLINFSNILQMQMHAAVNVFDISEFQLVEYVLWRIQDLQMGARSSAVGARIEASKAPKRFGTVREGRVWPHPPFLILDLTMTTLVHYCLYFYSLASCFRKNCAFGLGNLADACIQRAYNANHVTHH